MNDNDRLVRVSVQLRESQVKRLTDLKRELYGNADLRLNSEIMRNALDKYFMEHASHKEG